MQMYSAKLRWAAAQELREMVIRGAHEHPGAVAVEDELGRVILLHKLPLNVGCPPPCYRCAYGSRAYFLSCGNSAVEKPATLSYCCAIC